MDDKYRHDPGPTSHPIKSNGRFLCIHISKFSSQWVYIFFSGIFHVSIFIIITIFSLMVESFYLRNEFVCLLIPGENVFINRYAHLAQ